MSKDNRFGKDSHKAQAFVQSHANAALQRGDPYAISAAYLAGMDALARAVDGLAAQLRVSLYHFAQLVQQNTGVGAVAAAAEGVQSALSSAVIANSYASGNGWNHANSRGLTLFFPSGRSSDYRGQNYASRMGRIGLLLCIARVTASPRPASDESDA